MEADARVKATKIKWVCVGIEQQRLISSRTAYPRDVCADHIDTIQNILGTEWIERSRTNSDAIWQASAIHDAGEPAKVTVLSTYFGYPSIIPAS